MEILITFGINFLSQVLKKYVAPKYGENGVQFTVFLLACLASAGYIAYQKIQGFKEFITFAGAFFIVAIAFYETIFKKINAVKSTKQYEISN
jgi:hypothetical protein